MGGKVTEAQRNTIVRLLFHRCRQNEIASELGVSLAMVKKIERNLLDYGTPTNPNSPGSGRKPTVKPEILEEMLQLYETSGFDIDQKKLKLWLKNRHGAELTQSSISRYIKKSGRKKAVAVVAEAKKIQEEALKKHTEAAEASEERQTMVTGTNGLGQATPPASSSSLETQSEPASTTEPPLDPRLPAS